MKAHSYGICPYRIKNGKIEILMNKCNKYSKWNFFKGKIENGETFKECALREFQEETGIKLNENELENYFFQTNPSKNIGIFLYNFTNNEYNFKFQKREIYEAKWLNIDNLNEISKNQSKIYNEILKLLKPKIKWAKHIK